MKILRAFANNRVLRWVFALVWTFFLTILLLQPELQPVIPTGIQPAPPSFERELMFTTAHLIFFGLTALIWCFALEKELNPFMALLIAALFLLSYSFVTELAQATIPGRSPQLGDMLANTTGISLGLVFFRWQNKQVWPWRIE